ncbi:MAG: Peptidase clostripain [Candidatus Dependentiae bacterium]|nr:Peptidase clostripain [Candidatus Dependentiae bacterium]
MFKQMRIMMLYVVTLPFLCMAGGEYVPLANNDTSHEWAVLLYAVPETWGTYAMKNLDDAMTGICDDTTVAFACCNLSPNYWTLWQLFDGSLSQLERFIGPESHATRITRLMNSMVQQYPAKKYALILSGNGFGLANMVYDFGAKKWVAPGEKRAMLYNDNEGACLTNSEMIAALTAVRTVLGRNLDVLIADANSMMCAEIAAALSECVDIYVAPQSCQYISGFRYDLLFEALAGEAASSIDFARSIVGDSGEYYNSFPPEEGFGCYQGNRYFHSYAAVDCAQAGVLWKRFQLFMGALNGVLAQDQVLAGTMYRLRAGLTPSSFDACYVDFSVWLNHVRAVLAANTTSANVFSLVAESDDLLLWLRSSVLSTSIGYEAGDVRGISLCYPETDGFLMLNPADPWHQFIVASMARA